MYFRILGSLEVRDEQGHELQIAGGQRRGLLVILLLEAGKPVSSARLIDELWDENAPPSAAKIVQNHVSQLRRTLGDGQLVTRGHGYAVELEPGTLDIDRFEALAADGSRALAGGDARTASAKLHDALALWRGPALADFAEEAFAQAAIARLEERRLAVTEDRIDADLALGFDAELIGELEELVRRNPLRERPYAQLMLALYRSGRQAEALATYRAARTTLVEELGLEPGDELQELHRAILTHDPRLAGPSATAAASGGDIDSAEHPEHPEHPGRHRRRPRLLVALAAVLVAAGVGAAVLIVSGSRGRAVSIAGNAVAVLDPGSGRVVGHTALPTHPTAIGIGPGAVWVASADDGTVTCIDPKTRRIVATVASHATISDIAVGAGAVWVANSAKAELIRIDPLTDAVADRIDLTRPGSLFPQGLSSVVAGAGAVWVGSGNGTVLKVDPRADTLLDRIDVGTAAVDMALEHDSLWVALVAGYVMRIDTRTDKVTGTLAAAPYARAITAGNGAVWIISAPREGGGLVWRIDPETVTVAGGTTTLDSAPTGITTGAGDVWIAEGPSRTLVKLDPNSEHLTAIHLGSPPLDAAYGDAALWVTYAEPGSPTT